MTTKTIFSLIEGSFSIEEAQALLTDLYSSKIKFHSIRALKHEEFHGIRSVFHENRVLELKSERDRMLSHLSNKKEPIYISSTVSVD